MSIYDNETNIYPDLNPTAPQESETYRLNKFSEIETFFLNEIEKCEQKAKKIKRFITILSIADTSLITPMVPLEKYPLQVVLDCLLKLS